MSDVPKAPTTLTEDELDRLCEQYAGAGWEGVWRQFADAPRWNDEDEDEIPPARLKVQLEYVIDRWVGGYTADFPLRSDEERAVEAALRGKPKKLADLIRQPNQQLAPSTLVLVAEFLSGERNLRTGKAKGDPGRPRQSEKQRRANSIAHQATEIFFVIRSGLSIIYRKQTEAKIHHRAMLLAAMLKDVSPETIKDYMNKSKNDRLPYRVYGYSEEEVGPNGCWVEDLPGSNTYRNAAD